MIDQRSHAIVDYVAVAAFAMSPTVFSLQSVAAKASYALAAVHLLLTLTTNFPGGVLRWVPLRLHGAIELAVSLALPVLAAIGGAWLAPHERIFFAAAGVVILAVYLGSNYGRPVVASAAAQASAR